MVSVTTVSPLRTVRAGGCEPMVLYQRVASKRWVAM
jgi:hypothetical protein